MVINGPKGVAKMNIWLFVRFHAGTLFGEMEYLKWEFIAPFLCQKFKKIKNEKNMFLFVVTW